MTQHPPTSHRLRRAGRNVAVGPNDDPLRVDRRHVGLEVTELLLLLGMPPYFTASLFSLVIVHAELGGLASYWRNTLLQLRREEERP